MAAWRPSSALNNETRIRPPVSPELTGAIRRIQGLMNQGEGGAAAPVTHRSSSSRRMIIKEVSKEHERETDGRQGEERETNRNQLFPLQNTV